MTVLLIDERSVRREKVEQVFEPFVQVHRTLSDPTGGVGLGLAISREFTRAMDGRLTLESTVGKGSTFTVSLPLGHHRSSTKPS
jgi:signal transduction histidine kinase